MYFSYKQLQRTQQTTTNFATLELHNTQLFQMDSQNFCKKHTGEMGVRSRKVTKSYRSVEHATEIAKAAGYNGSKKEEMSPEYLVDQHRKKAPRVKAAKRTLRQKAKARDVARSRDRSNKENEI